MERDENYGKQFVGHPHPHHRRARVYGENWVEYRRKLSLPSRSQKLSGAIGVVRGRGGWLGSCTDIVLPPDRCSKKRVRIAELPFSDIHPSPPSLPRCLNVQNGIVCNSCAFILITLGTIETYGNLVVEYTERARAHSGAVCFAGIYRRHGKAGCSASGALRFRRCFFFCIVID